MSDPISFIDDIAWKTAQIVHQKSPIPYPYIRIVIQALVDHPELVCQLRGDDIALRVLDDNEALGEALASINEALGLPRGTASTVALDRIRLWREAREYE